MKRTPRNYQGTERTSKEIQEVLGSVLPQLQQLKLDDAPTLFRLWNEVIGEKLAALTQPLSFVNGVLTVRVRSATLYSLLNQHERARLLSELQRKNPQVQNIVFRV